MKETNLNNYKWIDIIEPTQLIESNLDWKVALISIVFFVIAALVVRYFNLAFKIKLWFIGRDLKNNTNSRLAAKKILELSCLDKNTENTINIISSYDKNKLLEIRNQLLEACYATEQVAPYKIIEILKYLNKSS